MMTTPKPFAPRSSGVLLHPTSLPGPYGCGDLGPEAYHWVRTLQAMQQSWWQILPLGPTGAGNSPYQSFSAFAGNVMLLSPELLIQEGLLPRGFGAEQQFRTDRVEYDRVIPFKHAVVREAFNRFQGGTGGAKLRGEYDAYLAREASWLDEYATYAAIRAALGGAGLNHWPKELRERQPAALAEMEKTTAGEADMHRFGQFLFDKQWTALKDFAHEHGVKVIGDAPIFVAMDSVDVWANPEEYLLDANRDPLAVAGVPPDYFSPTGQHWGNPLYDWKKMAATGYAWWVARLKRNLHQVDLIRLDHFRGFAAAWHIPADQPTALHGKWVRGPGADLFDRFVKELGDELPIIAEDLGLITPDVTELRERYGLPGMRVLQFMLGEPENLYWPHNYEPLTVCYTGTHDNDTTNGWYAGLNDTDRWQLGVYLGHPVRNAAEDLLRLAWASTARLAIAPMQDLLGLGGEARMNVPGVGVGNWEWRFHAGQLSRDAIDRVAGLTAMMNRVPGAGNKATAPASYL
jgi:4-alpha-glucanotransferase